MSLLFVSAIVAIFTLNMGYLNQKYEPPVYDNDTLSTYNQLNNVTALAEEIQEEEGNIETKSGLADILGDLFGKGYQAVRITRSSIDTMGTMADSASRDVNLGPGWAFVVRAVAAAIIIIIILGIIISALLKWWL